MQKTCATIATIEEARQRKRSHVSTKIRVTIQMACAKTAT